MILAPSVAQTLVLFMLMSVGFGAGKAGILDNAGGKGISRLLVNFILPALIVQSMQRPFTPELRDFAYAMLGVSFLSYAIAFPLAWLLVKAIGAKGAERGAHAFGAIFSNCAFMGFPVIEAILGKDAIFAASVANIPFQLLAFSVGPFILARTAGASVKLGISSFVTPAAIASIVGFALFAGGVALPRPLGNALGLLGDTTTPLSMILIGSIVSKMDFRAVAARPRLYATSVFRLALFPLGLYSSLRHRPQGHASFPSGNTCRDAGCREFGHTCGGIWRRRRDGELSRPHFHVDLPRHDSPARLGPFPDLALDASQGIYADRVRRTGRPVMTHIAPPCERLFAVPASELRSISDAASRAAPTVTKKHAPIIALFLAAIPFRIGAKSNAGAGI